MMGGGVLSYLVLIPAIKYFGSAASIAAGAGNGAHASPTCRSDRFRSAYILYIGAGAVAAGGIISLFRSIPLIWHGIKGRPRAISAAPGPAAKACRARIRTSR